MLKINIANAVKDVLLDNLIKNINVNANFAWEKLENENFTDGQYETMQNIFISLKNNPYCYPPFKDDVRMIIESYLPFVLFYIIKNNEVFIIDIKHKTELF